MGVFQRRGKGPYWYRFSFEGRRIQEGTGTYDREAAEQVEARHKRQLWEQARLGARPTRLWEEAVTSYVGTLPEGRNKEQTKAELTWQGQHLHGRPLAKISLDLLETVQEARREATVERTGRSASGSTVNRCMGIVMAVLHHAAAKKWIDHVPELAQMRSRPGVIRFLTRPEAERLISELPPHLQRMVIFALETGLRMSNITQLRWEQVDLARKVAWVDPDKAKEGKGIVVPLSAAAVNLLETVRGEHPEYVFVFRKRPVTKTSTKAWSSAKARAGIKNFRWHDLRHTWASWHRQDGTPTAALKELGGWTDDRMPSRYAHLGDEHLAWYVNRREGLGTQLDTVLKKQK